MLLPKIKMGWKRLDRKTIYDTDFLKVFEDKIELPNGSIKENYSVVEFPDIVVVVATDGRGNILTLDEYKYGMNKIARVFPAGHIIKGESPLEAGKRELLEETGYGGGEFILVGEVHEFPTKQMGIVFIVRATNVEKLGGQNLDEDESVELRIITQENLKREVLNNEWQTASSLSAIILTGILTS